MVKKIKDDIQNNDKLRFSEIFSQNFMKFRTNKIYELFLYPISYFFSYIRYARNLKCEISLFDCVTQRYLSFSGNVGAA